MRTTLLVVSNANRDRSPLAATMLSRYSHLDIRSAGFRPSGLRVGGPVREEAKRLGFDLELHRSTMISQDLVNWANVIVVMNPLQWFKITTTYGQRQYRVLLGAFLEPKVDSIPALGFIQGGSPNFHRVVGMIKEATESLAQCLKNTSSLKSSPSVKG